MCEPALLAGALFLLMQAPNPLSTLPPPPPTGVRVYLLRHGQALSNLDPEPDLPPEQLDHLTDLGKGQAEQAAAALAGRGIQVVLTSPASRARETAERIAKALKLDAPRVEPRLQPLQLGRTREGKALDWDARIAEWDAGRDPIPPAGESMEQMSDRVASLVAALARQGAGSVVLVAHGEVIGAYLGKLRGTTPAKRYPPGIGNASISVVDARPSEPEKLLLANHAPKAP